MNNRAIVGIILAAGESTRMKSETPKVLHLLLGRPMLEYVIESVRGIGVERILVVVGFKADRVIETFKDSGVEFVIQRKRLGTAHAVLQTSGCLDGFEGDCLILCGDTPLISSDTLKRILEIHFEKGAGLTILTAYLNDPTGYGRILRDAGGRITGIVEERDATAGQKRITEINTGVYCFKYRILFELLKKVGRDNMQGEYYLTDCICLANEAGITICDHVLEDSDEIIGVNSRQELVRATDLIRKKKLSVLGT